MELLIPGLILVALMVWASTKIKKTAADAFEAEFIETEKYSLQKPEGFLHVIGDESHEFMAYSRDFGKGDKIGTRQSTIEIDIIGNSDVARVEDAIRQAATTATVTLQTSASRELNVNETANEIDVRAFYKIVAADSDVYRLRFAVLPEYEDEYAGKIDPTLQSFTLK